MIFEFKMKRASARSMQGMSLVEIMVAVVIGLLGMIIISQVYSVSEERKRTTSGVGDAQVTGNISMFFLERELKLAGFGMVSQSGNMLGCATAAYDGLRATPNLAFPAMAPVQIAVGVAGAPDQITLIYGSSATAVDGAAFRANATNIPFPLVNAGGFSLGDLVVVSEAGNCAVAEVTGFTVAAPNDVEHGVGAAYTYTDTSSQVINATARHNAPGGIFPITTAAKLYSLGRNPVVKSYSVVNDKLMSQSLFPYDSTQDPDNDGWTDAEIADGVVQLKAQYGKDTNADGIVDLWNVTTPANANEWFQLRAVRVALVARSGQFEKTAVTADCIASNNPPNSVFWSGGCFTMTDPADGTNWRQYRYRVYETVVPLRNLIWSADP